MGFFGLGSKGYEREGLLLANAKAMIQASFDIEKTFKAPFMSKPLLISNSSCNPTIDEKMIQTFCRMIYTRGRSTRKPPPIT